MEAEMIAKAALEIGAIKLSPKEPFRWASGARMPIYNDNRLFLFYPKYRRMIAQALHRISYEIPYSVVAGTSTAGIPFGVSLANMVEAPFIYVRDKPKGHGLKNRIEGIDASRTLNGLEVVLVEDLISTGASALSAMKAIREAKGKINRCVCIFSYGFGVAQDAFLASSCRYDCVLTYDNLLQVAKKYGYIDESSEALLNEWGEDPFGWSASGS